MIHAMTVQKLVCQLDFAYLTPCMKDPNIAYSFFPHVDCEMLDYFVHVIHFLRSTTEVDCFL